METNSSRSPKKHLLGEKCHVKLLVSLWKPVFMLSAMASDSLMIKEK